LVTEERADEVRTLLATLRSWAQGHPDVVVVGLVGSWARGDARMDSDIDVVLLTEDQVPYLEDEAWVREVGGVGLVWTRRWGPVTERRFAPSKCPRRSCLFALAEHPGIPPLRRWINSLPPTLCHHRVPTTT
jgi:hypothetical protein